jgi:hypothetical protein
MWTLWITLALKSLFYRKYETKEAVKESICTLKQVKW